MSHHRWRGCRNGWAYDGDRSAGRADGAGAFAPSPNPHRLYRDPERAVIRGLCAGIADYIGVEPWLVRAFAIVALIVFPPQTIAAYFIASCFIRPRPPGLWRDREEQVFWRSVTVRPSETFAELRYTFGALEERLGGLERHVTSEEFKLRRDFRDLEGGPKRTEP
jgi:phage shock protein C